MSLSRGRPEMRDATVKLNAERGLGFKYQPA